MLAGMLKQKTIKSVIYDFSHITATYIEEIFKYLKQ